MAIRPKFVPALLVVATSIALLTLYAPSISAQDGAQTPGFLLGERLVLHSQLESAGGYNSNVFRGIGANAGSAMVRVGAGLRLSTLDGPRLQGGGKPKIRFDGGVNAQFIHLFENNTRSGVALGADLGLVVNPEGRFRLIVGNDFQRRVLPFTGRGAVNNNYAFINNDATVGFEAASAGDALRGRTTYSLGAGIFEGRSFSFANRLSHEVAHQTSWNFFPNSSFQHRVSYRYIDLYNFDVDSPQTTQLLSNFHQLESTVGLVSAITPKLGYTLEIGYGAGITTDDRLSDRDALLATAELRYDFVADSNISLGYRRGLRVTPSSRSIVADEGRFDISTQRLARFNFHAGAGVSYWRYSEFLDASGAPIDAANALRNDVVVQADAGVDFAMLNWLLLFGEYSYRQVITDFSFATNTGAGGVVLDPADFSQSIVWGGLRAKY